MPILSCRFGQLIDEKERDLGEIMQNVEHENPPSIEK